MLDDREDSASGRKKDLLQAIIAGGLTLEERLGVAHLVGGSRTIETSCYLQQSLLDPSPIVI